MVIIKGQKHNNSLSWAQRPSLRPQAWTSRDVCLSVMYQLCDDRSPRVELDLTRRSFEKDGSELNRLQLALLLSLPGASFRDDNAAIALLQPFVKDKGREGSTLRPLAILLQSELLELRRTDEALQQQSAKLKEELRRTDETLRRTDEALQQQSARLKEEQRRVEALQQKLEAILDMEMKMIEREQNLPKKK